MRIPTTVALRPEKRELKKLSKFSRSSGFRICYRKHFCIEGPNIGTMQSCVRVASVARGNAWCSIQSIRRRFGMARALAYAFPRVDSYTAKRRSSIDAAFRFVLGCDIATISFRSQINAVQIREYLMKLRQCPVYALHFSGCAFHQLDSDGTDQWAEHET